MRECNNVSLAQKIFAKTHGHPQKIFWDRASSQKHHKQNVYKYFHGKDTNLEMELLIHMKKTTIDQLKF